MTRFSYAGLYAIGMVILGIALAATSVVLFLGLTDKSRELETFYGVLSTVASVGAFWVAYRIATFGKREE